MALAESSRIIELRETGRKLTPVARCPMEPKDDSVVQVRVRRQAKLPTGPFTIFLGNEHKKDELLKKGVELNRRKDPNNWETIVEKFRKRHA